MSYPKANANRRADRGDGYGADAGRANSARRAHDGAGRTADANPRADANANGTADADDSACYSVELGRRDFTFFQLAYPSSRRRTSGSCVSLGYISRSRCRPCASSAL